jgi:hypothetical protein
MSFILLPTKRQINYYPTAGKITHYQFNPNVFEKILSILTHISQEYTDKQDGHLEVIKANMKIFFIELVRQYSSNPSEAPTFMYRNDSRNC